MKPTKALELIHRYSELTWQIKAARNQIAMALDKCTGLDGKRLERRRAMESPPYEPMDAMQAGDNEKQVHLSKWYEPEECGNEYSGPYLVWHTPDADNLAECVHCYAAHCIIQKRKAWRKQLGSVKAAMTRTTPKPKILDWKPPQREDF